MLKSEIILVLHYACSQLGEQLCERKMLKVSIIRMFTYANEASVVISLKKNEQFLAMKMYTINLSNSNAPYYIL